MYHVIGSACELISNQGQDSRVRQSCRNKSSRTYKGKTYRSHSKGAVEKVGGWKLGRGSCIVPEKAWSQIEKVLNKRKVKRWSFTVTQMFTRDNPAMVMAAVLCQSTLL